MALSGNDYETLVGAISRYLSLSELSRALKYYAGLDIESVSLAANKQQLVFEVIGHADRHGELTTLITAVARINPAPALLTALGPWLPHGVVHEMPPVAVQTLAVPPWALSYLQKVDIVRGLPHRRVPPFVFEELPIKYAQALDSNYSQLAMNEANRIRKDADPEFDEVSMAVPFLPRYGDVGPLTYWLSAFTQAAKSSRMMGSLLLTANGDLYSAEKLMIERVFAQLY